MPLFGTLDVGALDGVPTMTLLDASELTLAGAELLQIHYEIDAVDLTAVLPPACQPTIPPTLTLLVLHCPASEHGPVTMAQLRIGCRSGIWPRNYLLAAVVAEPEAAEALGARWGVRSLTGQVEVSARHDRVEAVVTSADGETLAHTALVDPQPISGRDLWYAPNLHLADTPRGRRLVHVDLQFTEVGQADRGRAEIATLDAGAWGEARIVPRYPISASFVVGDLRLSHVGLLNDPQLPAVEGTEKLG
jgi:hypothetical protein